VTKKIVARVEDLMFRGKIDAAARNLGVPVAFVARLEDLPSACADHPAALFVELTPAALEAVARLKREPAGKDVPVVGFLAHLDKDLAEDARTKSVDRVLSRAQFSETLPELLLEFTAPGIERTPEQEPELPEE
jgi:CheY-like chemotaxis protein